MIDASRGDDPKYDLILLDELNIVLRQASIDEVVEFLEAGAPCHRDRPKYGRSSSPT